jgi:hypothetical protein
VNDFKHKWPVTSIKQSSQHHLGPQRDQIPLGLQWLFLIPHIKRAHASYRHVPECFHWHHSYLHIMIYFSLGPSGYVQRQRQLKTYTSAGDLNFDDYLPKTNFHITPPPPPSPVSLLILQQELSYRFSTKIDLSKPHTETVNISLILLWQTYKVTYTNPNVCYNPSFSTISFPLGTNILLSTLLQTFRIYVLA